MIDNIYVSIKEIAEACGVTERTVKRWFAGYYTPVRRGLAVVEGDDFLGMIFNDKFYGYALKILDLKEDELDFNKIDKLVGKALSKLLDTFTLYIRDDSGTIPKDNPSTWAIKANVKIQAI